MSSAQEPSTEVDLLDQVVSLATGQDSFAATTHVESLGGPTDVAQAYANLTQQLYYKRKDVPLMLKVGTAGVRYCLHEGERTKDDNPELSAKLRGAAKMIAYNLAVNCWPAWEDEGIQLSPAEVAYGFDLAKLNLRLGQELERPADKLAAAWWLLGAHQLAAKERDNAIASFEKAAGLYAEAEQTDGQWMSKGYAAIARHVSTDSVEPTDSGEQGAADLKEAIDALRKLDTDDSRFYADQLKAVDKFFTK